MLAGPFDHSALFDYLRALLGPICLIALRSKRRARDFRNRNPPKHIALLGTEGDEGNWGTDYGLFVGPSFTSRSRM